MSKRGTKEKNNIKIKFEFALRSVNGLSPKTNEKYVFITWKRGSKKENKGESKRVKVNNGVANFNDETLQFEATMVHHEKLKKWDSKTIDVAIKEVNIENKFLFLWLNRSLFRNKGKRVQPYTRWRSIWANLQLTARMLPRNSSFHQKPKPLLRQGSR